MYYGVLALDLPIIVATIDFVEDIGLSPIARLLDEVETDVNEPV